MIMEQNRWETTFGIDVEGEITYDHYPEETH